VSVRVVPTGKAIEESVDLACLCRARHKRTRFSTGFFGGCRSGSRRSSRAQTRKCLTLESVPRCILASMSQRVKTLRVGELAIASGVSSDTLRHYERLGILPTAPRTASGYRVFAPDAVDRVSLVQRALQLGFTLSELAEILQAHDTGEAPCHRVLDMMEEKLRTLEQRIQELRRTERYMRELVQDWKPRLTNTPLGKKAHLLRTLQDKPNLLARPFENLNRRKRA